jgi:hypothetical protein
MESWNCAWKTNTRQRKQPPWFSEISKGFYEKTQNQIIFWPFTIYKALNRLLNFKNTISSSMKLRDKENPDC